MKSKDEEEDHLIRQVHRRPGSCHYGFKTFGIVKETGKKSGAAGS